MIATPLIKNKKKAKVAIFALLLFSLSAMSMYINEKRLISNAVEFTESAATFNSDRFGDAKYKIGDWGNPRDYYLHSRDVREMRTEIEGWRSFSLIYLIPSILSLIAASVSCGYYLLQNSNGSCNQCRKTISLQATVCPYCKNCLNLPVTQTGKPESNVPSGSITKAKDPGNIINSKCDLKNFKVCQSCLKEVRSAAIKCKYCDHSFEATQPVSKNADEPIHKACPACAKEVKSAAVKCKYCGHTFA